MGDSPSVGYYGFAYRVVDLAFPLSFFFVGSVFPLLSTFHADGDHAEFKKLYQRSHDLLSLIGMSIVTATILFAPPLVRLIGVEWDDEHFYHPDERAIASAVDRLSAWMATRN